MHRHMEEGVDPRMVQYLGHLLQRTKKKTEMHRHKLILLYVISSIICLILINILESIKWQQKKPLKKLKKTKITATKKRYNIRLLQHNAIE